MKRGWLDDEPKSAAQKQFDEDMKEAREVWNLLSNSQQERFAKADGSMSSFMECISHFCLEKRKTMR